MILMSVIRVWMLHFAVWKWNTMYDTQLSDGEEDDADFENDNEESIEQRVSLSI